jgi:pyrroloquinoline quinone (PQQ) biosynthesis protein C
MPATHTFVEQLRQARDATHSKNHPYFRKWAQGDLTKKQMGFYLVMHYHFVTEYLNWLAHMWAHCPVEEVKRHILENLSEEEDPRDRHWLHARRGPWRHDAALDRGTHRLGMACGDPASLAGSPDRFDHWARIATT